MFPCLHHHHRHHTTTTTTTTTNNNNNSNDNNSDRIIIIIIIIIINLGKFFGSYLKPAIFVDSTIVFAGFAPSVKPQCKQDDHSSRRL